MARKSSFSSRARGNAPAASLATAGRGFMEFHPSMSLENAPTLADCLPEPTKVVLPSQSLAAEDSKDITLEQALADRCQVWTKVNEMIEKLTPLQAYQGDVHALQKLQQLHLLCKQRETHLRTLQLTLLREGRAPPSAGVVTAVETPTEIDQGDNCIDAFNANETEWQQDQERHLDFVDYDAMDLIELSEQFA